MRIVYIMTAILGVAYRIHMPGPSSISKFPFHQTLAYPSYPQAQLLAVQASCSKPACKSSFLYQLQRRASFTDHPFFPQQDEIPKGQTSGQDQAVRPAPPFWFREALDASSDQLQ